MKKTIQIIARAMLWSILKKTIRIKYRLFGLPSWKTRPYIVTSSQIQKLAAESKRIRIRLHETEQLIAAVKRQQQNSNKEFVKKKGFGNDGNNHKTLKIILLILLISAAQWYALNAQVPSDLTPLKIGDKVPEITVNNIINYKSSSAKLSDFKGKLLILDFWATWCAPCITMMPKMEKLQEQFLGRIQFLPVTYQAETVVRPFLEKLKSQNQFRDLKLPKAVGDNVLNDLFPHVYLPHYVWISASGSVLAITSHDKITEANINTALTGQSVSIVQKNDIRIPYDRNKPFLIANNGLNSKSVRYQSVLTGYSDGLGGGYTLAKGDSIPGDRITARNLPVSALFRLAYGEGRRSLGINRTILDVKDPSRLINNTQVSDEYKSWLSTGNGYCYELIVTSPAMDRFKIMQLDLQRFFPEYDARIEYRKVKCLVLVRTSGEHKITSAGGLEEMKTDASGIRMKNSYLSQFVAGLYSYFYQVSPYQLVNETDFTSRADITINGDPGDITLLNRELQKYDLKFIEAEREREVLVITDKKMAGVN